MKVSVFIAVSLDGYIARKDGNLDWLDEANTRVPAGEDCGYGKFIASVDVLIMGRKSFEKVLSFGGWHYGELPVVVWSRQGVEIPNPLAGTVSCSSEAPQALLERLAQAGHQHAYVDGGLTVQSFIHAGLVNELIITTLPVLLGEGIPLFAPAPHGQSPTQWLQLLQCQYFPFGYVQTHWKVEST
ncbi:MAG TPA: dihydrofolate reductase family protein [Anaerolineales bacterium]|nr:dihydrofolate reductase family protein [Anaerolineales bacterium]